MDGCIKTERRCIVELSKEPRQTLEVPEGHEWGRLFTRGDITIQFGDREEKFSENRWHMFDCWDLDEITISRKYQIATNQEGEDFIMPRSYDRSWRDEVTICFWMGRR
jgi:hypothetical protein